MPKLGPLEKPLRILRRQLPPLNFITIHYLYFIITCMLSSVIIWGSATPFRSLSYTNALFLSVSAMTEAGLNTVNLSSLNTFQQFWLFLQIILGSAIWVSAFVVLVRRKAFETRFRDVIQKQREKERERRGRSRSRSHTRAWSLSRAIPLGKTQQPEKENEQAAGKEDDQTADKESDQIANKVEDKPAESIKRDTTPPARCGQFELSPVSSNEKSPSSDDPDEELANGPLVPMSTGRSEIKFSEDTVFASRRQPQSPTPMRRRPGIFAAQGVGARSSASLHSKSPARAVADGDEPVPHTFPGLRKGTGRYFASVGGYIGRNSEFHGLTDKERERLGGYEYRAVKILSWLVPLYFILWQLLGSLGCMAWVMVHRPGTAEANGISPGWVGAFNAVSAFNNSGMSLLDANMTAFQNAWYLLITMGLLILAGNTAYPLFLRLFVWTMYRVVKKLEDRFEGWDEHANTLKFLLDHPRRCYTNLFPSQHTWWLLVCVITLNGVDWAFFEILNIGNAQIQLTTGERVIDGLFQALAVRSGGFYVVNISSIRISLQVLYVVMMYISVYPVVITMRNSNVYEERSLGIYADDEQAYGAKQEEPGFLRQLTGHFVGAGPVTQESNSHFVRQQLRAQLAHDAWTIVLALFLIMIIEGSQFREDPAQFSVFNFLFEIVSGYGCVGISVGLQNEAYSFSGSWHVLSKLILCFVMLKGRHRGLPVAIDKAVLLPGEAHEKAEEADGRIRLARTMSRNGQEGV